MRCKIYTDEEGCRKMDFNCQICGDSLKMDIMVDDDLWERIKPEGETKRSAVLCSSCIMKRLETIVGKYDCYRLTRIWVHPSHK